jgi:hypothetical protein
MGARAVPELSQQEAEWDRDMFWEDEVLSYRVRPDLELERALELERVELLSRLSEQPRAPTSWSE